jgi:hypothetical protein
VKWCTSYGLCNDATAGTAADAAAALSTSSSS